MHNPSYHNEDLILEVANSQGIDDQSFIEKDLFVTQAIEAISQVTSLYFKPIFAGGTCLAKAHQLINRISEDVDFKIAQKEPALVLSKEALRRELKKYHSAIVEALKLSGFGIDQDTILVRNERRYTQIQLHYPSFYEGGATLRPHVLVEFTLSNPKLVTQFLQVDSMVGIYLGDQRDLQIECVSALETAAEKWVALARQVSAVERGIYKPDRNIVRHLYDLYQINQQLELGKAFVDLAVTIIKQDAEKFGSQHPELLENPLNEITQAINVLKSPRYQQYYKDYVLRMLISKESLSYQKAFENFDILTARVCHALRT